MGKKLSDNIKPRFITAYKKTLGNMTLSCKNLNVNRQTIWRLRKEDSEFDKALIEIRENEIGDFVENALMQRIQEGDTTAIIFACKTLCKNRGYVERQEHIVTTNPFELMIKDLPDIE